MNSFLLPRRVNVCRSRISVVFWSDRFLPPTARIAEVFAVTLVFFSTACQQKGALPACLASRGFPHYLFEHIVVSAQTCNNAPFANCVLLFFIFNLASWAYERCPTGRVCTKELPGWQSTSGGQKGSTDGTSLRCIWTLKRFYSSPHFLSFAIQRVQWIVYKIASWWVESFFKINRFRVSKADIFSWYWIALCVVNGVGQILWILRMFFCAISW